MENNPAANARFDEMLNISIKIVTVVQATFPFASVTTKPEEWVHLFLLLPV